MPFNLWEKSLLNFYSLATGSQKKCRDDKILDFVEIDHVIFEFVKKFYQFFNSVNQIGISSVKSLKNKNCISFFSSLFPVLKSKMYTVYIKFEVNSTISDIPVFFLGTQQESDDVHDFCNVFMHLKVVLLSFSNFVSQWKQLVCQERDTKRLNRQR